MKTAESVIEIIPSGMCSGTIDIPASKSHAQRALACALLSDKRTVLHGIGRSNDEQVLLELVRKSAAKFVKTGDTIILEAGEKLQFENPHIHFGESGLAARMCTPIVANCGQELTLSGEGSLTERPMDLFGAALPKLGITYSDNKGKLPIRLKGPLEPTDLTIDGNLSSQFITGILYGIAGSKKEHRTTLTVENLKSTPYLDLSLEVLREFGAEAERNDRKITLSTPVIWRDTELTVEGDWSSASFLLVLAAISGEITVTNLRPDSQQADRRITEVLEQFGAVVSWHGSALTVQKKVRQSFVFDATHCPDLFPPLAALACFGNTPSRITGLHRLINKESNRALTLQSELGKLGARITFENDDMIVEPIRAVRSCTVDSCNDHRIAMTCAIVILQGTRSGKILRPEAVNKSFPDFFHYIQQLTAATKNGSH